MADTVEFENTKCIRESDSGKAILVLIDGKTVWIPNFAVDNDSEVWKPGQEGKLVIREAIAIEKGLV